MNKREEIQKVAIRLFLEKGYSNVTIMDICNELNITKPTFYKYVEAKEDLIIDLYDLIVKKITSNVLKVIDVDSSIERLVLIFNELMNETIAYNSDLYSQMLIANLNENRHSFANVARCILEQSCFVLVDAREKIAFAPSAGCVLGRRVVRYIVSRQEEI